MGRVELGLVRARVGEKDGGVRVGWENRKKRANQGKATLYRGRRRFVCECVALVFKNLNLVVGSSPAVWERGGDGLSTRLPPSGGAGGWFRHRTSQWSVAEAGIDPSAVSSQQSAVRSKQKRGKHHRRGAGGEVNRGEVGRAQISRPRSGSRWSSTGR